jgi:uncharacterized protein (DUF433 family)
VADVAVLERELYTEGEAARLLRVAPSTLHYWLEGEGGRGKSHRPVIRPDRRGRGASVTWAEFVEAGLLREYRKQVHMSTLREFIDHLRQEFGVPYPLADRRPWVDQGRGRKLVWEAQISSGVKPEMALVVKVGDSDQYVLTHASQSFYDRVEWDGDLPSGYRPADDPESQVRCLPSIRFGRPSVRGISTEAIGEQRASGLDDDEIAATYGISEDEVFSAIAYERSLRRSSAA